MSFQACDVISGYILQHFSEQISFFRRRSSGYFHHGWAVDVAKKYGEQLIDTGIFSESSLDLLQAISK